MKLIPLTQGKFAIVDDQDYDELSKFKWTFDGGYAIRMSSSKGAVKRRKIQIHRDVMNPPENMEVDHINLDGLDNRRSNLRICSRIENSRNIPKSPLNTSGFKGVSFDKSNGRWKSKIRIGDGVNSKHIGYFDTPQEAGNAYKKSALKFHGEFSNTN